MVIGTCSICSGSVEMPDVWHGIYPPIPVCRQCGAVSKESYGPVIPMKPRSKDNINSNATARWGNRIIPYSEPVKTSPS